jgi:hypothetical protein
MCEEEFDELLILTTDARISVEVLDDEDAG